MANRCKDCGTYTGETIAETNEFMRLHGHEHGLGRCTTACIYCRDGIKHSPSVCSNVKPGMAYEEWPSFVQDFVNYWGKK